MSDLNPETRAFLDAVRDGDDPAVVDRSRVKKALFAQLGIGVAIGTTAAATSTSAAAAATGAAAGPGSILAITAKVVAGIAIVGGLAGGGAALYHASSPPPPRASIASAPSSANEATTAPPIASAVAATSPVEVATPPVEVASTPEPSVASAAPSTAAPRQPAADPKPAPSLSGELALLAKADASIRKGDGTAALAELDAHRRAFPKGEMSEERDAYRVLALCAAGRGDEARDLARAFLQAHPRSPAAERIASSCAGSDRAP